MSFLQQVDQQLVLAVLKRRERTAQLRAGQALAQRLLEIDGRPAVGDRVGEPAPLALRHRQIAQRQDFSRPIQNPAAERQSLVEGRERSFGFAEAPPRAPLSRERRAQAQKIVSLPANHERLVEVLERLPIVAEVGVRLADCVERTRFVLLPAAVTGQLQRFQMKGERLMVPAEQPLHVAHVVERYRLAVDVAGATKLRQRLAVSVERFVECADVLVRHTEVIECEF